MVAGKLLRLWPQIQWKGGRTDVDPVAHVWQGLIMIYRTQSLLLVVAGLFVTLALPIVSAADGDSPRSRKTVRDLILEIGAPGKEFKQLKLKIEGTVVGKEFATLPKKMTIDLRYDKAENRVYLKTDSTFGNDDTRSVTVYGNQERAVKWIERSPRTEGGEPIFIVERLEIPKTLPNPWRLPMGLKFPGMFADSLHGYEALSREFARSQRINREPDEEGLTWFNLRPSPGVANILQREFNSGMQVKIGVAADGGWMKRMQVNYPKSGSLIDFRVVEQSTELSEEDVAIFKANGDGMYVPSSVAVGLVVM